MLASLKPVPPPSTKSGRPRACRALAYDVDETNSALDSIKAGLLTRLADPSEAGLLAYVEDSFPPPVVPSVAMERCFDHGGSVVEGAVVDKAIGLVRSLIDTVSKVTPIISTLKIESTPPNAKFTLRPKRGSAAGHTNTTDSSVWNLHRGVYLLTVTKADHSAINSFEVNLVNVPRPRIKCELKTTASKQESFCRCETEPKRKSYELLGY